jgi:hypothetical protein
MTRKALARRIAEPYLTSQQRREAPAPPQPEGLRGFWPGALLLVSQRPQRVFSFLASRTQPSRPTTGTMRANSGPVSGINSTSLANRQYLSNSFFPS